MPELKHGELPPIPMGSGILPVAENRIAHGPHPELLDAVPEGYEPVLHGPERDLPPPNDDLEPHYRLVLARALALAAAGLLLAAVVGWSLKENTQLSLGLLGFGNVRLLLYGVLGAQLLFTHLCNDSMERLPLLPASVLLFGYAVFCGMEFSVIFSPRLLALFCLCAGVTYACAAAWGYATGGDLANPLVGGLMMAIGGPAAFAFNYFLGNSKALWAFSSASVVAFALLEMYFAQKIRDLYQDFDDDNPQGWKASVVGALLLLVNSVNAYLLLLTMAGRRTGDEQSD